MRTAQQAGRKVGLPMRPALLAILGLLAALTLAACGPGQVPAANTPAREAQVRAATQTSQEGQVTVAVTWDGPASGSTFRVVMDTHAVDLDGYDLRQLATLRADGGAELRPIGWDAPKGGHHRSGTLVFPATAADGSLVIGPGTRAVELVIRDVAGVPERRFQWTL